MLLVDAAQYGGEMGVDSIADVGAFGVHLHIADEAGEHLEEDAGALEDQRQVVGDGEQAFEIGDDVAGGVEILAHEMGVDGVRPNEYRDGGALVKLDRKSTRLNSSHMSISYAV